MYQRPEVALNCLVECITELLLYVWLFLIRVNSDGGLYTGAWFPCSC